MSDIYTLKIQIQKLSDDTHMLDIKALMESTHADIIALQAFLEDGDIWNNTDMAISKTQELQYKKTLYDMCYSIDNGVKTLLDMVNSASDDDYEMLYDEYNASKYV